MADRSILGVAVGGLALVAAGASLVMSLDAREQAHAAAPASEPRVLGTPVAAEPSRAPAVLESAPADERLLRALDEVRARLARVEGRVGLGPRAPGDDGKDAAPATAPAAAAPSPITEAERAEHDALREKVFSGKATNEERRRFWLLARAAGMVDSAIAVLEKALEATPDDVGARMRLADGYISKLFLVPHGPEKGIWAAKAEAQWSAVLARDERNWDARFALAFDYSQYPEFLNKVPDSIREFETLRRFQEQGAPEAQQAQVYVQLSSLYKRQAQADKARQILEAGLARHPDDAEITKALEALRR